MNKSNNIMKIVGFTKVIGDGFKYIEFEGELIPLVSRSATGMLNHGDTIYAALLNNGYADIYNNE
jgi:hypothetical protein